MLVITGKGDFTKREKAGRKTTNVLPASSDKYAALPSLSLAHSPTAGNIRYYPQRRKSRFSLIVATRVKL
jgi:hypothetical protein